MSAPLRPSVISPDPSVLNGSRRRPRSPSSNDSSLFSAANGSSSSELFAQQGQPPPLKEQKTGAASSAAAGDSAAACGLSPQEIHQQFQEYAKNEQEEAWPYFQEHWKILLSIPDGVADESNVPPPGKNWVRAQEALMSALLMVSANPLPSLPSERMLLDIWEQIPDICKAGILLTNIPSKVHADSWSDGKINLFSYALLYRLPHLASAFLKLVSQCKDNAFYKQVDFDSIFTGSSVRLPNLHLAIDRKFIPLALDIIQCTRDKTRLEHLKLLKFNPCFSTAVFCRSGLAVALQLLKNAPDTSSDFLMQPYIEYEASEIGNEVCSNPFIFFITRFCKAYPDKDPQEIFSLLRSRASLPRAIFDTLPTFKSVSPVDHENSDFAERGARFMGLDINFENACERQNIQRIVRNLEGFFCFDLQAELGHLPHYATIEKNMRELWVLFVNAKIPAKYSFVAGSKITIFDGLFQIIENLSRDESKNFFEIFKPTVNLIGSLIPYASEETLGLKPNLKVGNTTTHLLNISLEFYRLVFDHSDSVFRNLLKSSKKKETQNLPPVKKKGNKKLSSVDALLQCKLEFAQMLENKIILPLIQRMSSEVLSESGLAHETFSQALLCTRAAPYSSIHKEGPNIRIASAILEKSSKRFLNDIPRVTDNSWRFSHTELGTAVLAAKDNDDTLESAVKQQVRAHMGIRETLRSYESLISHGGVLYEGGLFDKELRCIIGNLLCTFMVNNFEFVRAQNGSKPLSPAGVRFQRLYQDRLNGLREFIDILPAYKNVHATKTLSEITNIPNEIINITLEYVLNQMDDGDVNWELIHQYFVLQGLLAPKDGLLSAKRQIDFCVFLVKSSVTVNNFERQWKSIPTSSLEKETLKGKLLAQAKAQVKGYATDFGFQLSGEEKFNELWELFEAFYYSK